MYDPISKMWHFSSIMTWVDFAISLIAIVFLLVVTINAARRTVFTIVSIIAAKEMARSIQVTIDLKCHILLIGSYIELSPFKSQLAL